MAEPENSSVRIEKLGDDNYATWKTGMRFVLTDKGLWSCVQGEGVTRATDSKALAQIGLHVLPQHYDTIQACTTAKEAWDALEDVYNTKSKAMRLKLRRDLNSLKKTPKESITAYVARAKGLRDKLKAAGHTVDETEVGWYILAGLPPHYAPIVTVLKREEFTLESLLADLLEMEQTPTEDDIHDQEMALLGYKKGFGHRKGNCHRCGKEGHYARECPLKNKFKEEDKVEPALPVFKV